MLDAVVWPDVWPSWRLFVELSGQWRTEGMDARAVALDYTPLFMRMDRLGLTDDEWEDRFADIRTLEAAALERMRLNRA